MARYTESVCRLCRREGLKLFLKGSRCYTKKCSFERRPTPPGQHGVRRRKMGDAAKELIPEDHDIGTAARILDRFLNLLPTVTIREGHRIKVYLANDLDLPAYREITLATGGRP